MVVARSQPFVWSTIIVPIFVLLYLYPTSSDEQQTTNNNSCVDNNGIVCSGNGTCVYYSDGSSYCSCRSGQYMDDCSMDIQACQPYYTEESKTAPNYGINITLISYDSNSLVICVTLPLERTRWHTTLVLGPYLITQDNPNCAYPGKIWNKTVTGSCLDLYTAVMNLPHLQNECGWSITSTSASIDFTMNAYEYVQGSVTIPPKVMTYSQRLIYYFIVSDSLMYNSSFSSPVDTSKTVAGTVILVLMALCIFLSLLFNSLLRPCVKYLPDDVLASNAWLIGGSNRVVPGNILHKQRQGNSIIITWEDNTSDEVNDEEVASSNDDEDEDTSNSNNSLSETSMDSI